MIFKSLDLKYDNGLVLLTLNQPDRGNPYDAVFCREFCEAIDSISINKDARAILITAKGKYFCVGGDIRMFTRDRSGLPAGILEWTRQLHAGMVRLWQGDAPVVTAVQGMAMGGSMGLIGGSDVVYCAKSAKLGAAYTNIGFSCDAGVSFALASRMGMARARRFLLLGEILGASEAQQAGLVDFVSADDQVLVEAEKCARQLAEGPTRAFGQIRRLMQSVLRRGAEAQLEQEAQGLARIAGGDDAWEGLMAFMDRRKPMFQGR